MEPPRRKAVPPPGPLFVLILWGALLAGPLSPPVRAQGEARAPRTGETAPPRPLSGLLERTWNLDRLFQPEPGVTSRQFSSYDRSGPKANRDWGNYLRASPEEGRVIAEMKGPGCVVRLWSANPSGRIFFYLDGAEAPVLETAFSDLFEGDHFPFLDPLCYHLSGADAYLPIPFAKSCRIVLRDNAPLYYHVGYLTFPETMPVESFSPARAETARPALDHALEVLKNPGPGAVHTLYPDALEEHTFSVTAEAGEPAKLFARRGPGRIALLALSARSTERHFLRKTMLRIYWDGEETPAVDCPLGDFFGAPFGWHAYRALPLGVTEEGGGYCLFPMPFESEARIAILNQGTLPVEVSGRVVLGPLEYEGRFFRFHAKWRRENPCKVFDYPVLEVHGAGRFVGCALSVDNPRRAWWGEGDEKIHVDGEAAPSFQGTGTEDYFGDAWGFRYHVRPFEGCTFLQGPGHSNKTCVYRFHVSDSIPFTRSFRMTIENYAEDVDYASTAWWYAFPGSTDFFHETPVKARIPEKPRAPDAFEAETVAARAEAGKALVTDDENLPEELSRGAGLLLKGAGPFILDLPGDEAGNYTLYLGFAHGLEHGAVKLSGVEGMPVRSLNVPAGTPGFLERTPAAVVHLEKGGPRTVRLAPTGPGATQARMILDFAALEPVSRLPRALEAESLEVIVQEGGTARVEHVTLPWSGGAQLRFDAEAPDARLTLALPIRAEGAYTLTGICTRTEGYGRFSVAVDGRTLGEVDPAALESPEAVEGTAAFTLPAMALAAGRHILEIRTAGRVGIDCLFPRWSLGTKNAFEGEALEVLDHQRGEVSVQSLDDDRFSGGRQLWFKGTEGGAFCETALSVDRTGVYTVKIYFTKSWDYGVVRVFLDGEPLGEPFDGYSPRIEPSGPVGFGSRDLAAGTHRLKFVVVDRNERSTGYYLGVDGVVLVPAEEH